MSKYVKAVIYEIESQSTGGRFSVPQEALASLKVVGSRVHLVVENAITGERYFEGEKQLGSGTEIYGQDVKHIPAKTLLRVTVSSADG